MPLTQLDAARATPRNRGLARGWQRGRFSGTHRRACPTSSTRRRQGPARAGATTTARVAWYRTSFSAPARRASTRSLPARPTTRRPCSSTGASSAPTAAPTCRSKIRARLAAGAHTVVVRVDWRDPARQSRRRLSPHLVQLGRARRRGRRAPDRRQRAAEPTIATTLRRHAGRPRRGVRGQRATCATTAPRTHDRAGRLARARRARRSRRFPARTLAPGRRRPSTGDRRPSPTPALWSPGHPNLYELSLAVPGESSYSARVGLRQLTLARRARVPQRPAAAAARRVAPGGRPGHGDALTPARPGRLVAELKAIGANAVRAQHPLDPALLERLDAAGHPRVAGDRPGRRRRATGTRTRRGCCAEAEQQARTAARRRGAAPVDLRLEPRRRGRRQRARRAEVRYVQTTHARWLHAHDPGRHGRRRHLGRPPARRTPARSTAASTRSPRPTTPAGTTPARQPRAAAARDARAPAAHGAHVPRQGAA